MTMTSSDRKEELSVAFMTLLEEIQDSESNAETKDEKMYYARIFNAVFSVALDFDIPEEGKEKKWTLTLS